MFTKFCFSLFSDKLILLFPKKKPDAEHQVFLAFKIINSVLYEGFHTQFSDSLPDRCRLRY